MSKKKLLLASAVFAAGVFTASCGGGGGGTTSTTPTPPPPPPPTPNKVAEVYVSAQKGFTSPGALIGHYKGEVFDDGSVQWTEIPTPFDTYLAQVHEFENGNVLLTGFIPGPPPAPTAPFFFNGTAINSISGCTDIGTGGPVAPATYSAGSAISLPNFVVFDGGGNINYIYTSNGTCLADLGGSSDSLLYAGKEYILYEDGTGNLFVVKKDGTVIQVDGNSNPTDGIQSFPGTPVVFDRVDGKDVIVVGTIGLGSADGANPGALVVIMQDGTPVYLTDATDTSVANDPPTWGYQNIGDVRITEDANGNYYVVALDRNDSNTLPDGDGDGYIGSPGEIAGDGIGNDNGVCEAGEACIPAGQIFYWKIYTQAGTATVFAHASAPIVFWDMDDGNSAVGGGIYFGVETGSGDGDGVCEVGEICNGYHSFPVAFDGNGVAYVIADMDSAYDTSSEVLHFWINGTNSTVGPMVVDVDPSNAFEPAILGWAPIGFSNGILLTDGSSHSHFVYPNSAPTTPIVAGLNVRFAITNCEWAKNDELSDPAYSSLGRQTVPMYSGIITERLYGEGISNTIQCASSAMTLPNGAITASPTDEFYAWLTSDGAGSYSGDTYDPTDPTNTGDAIVATYYASTGNSFVFTSGGTASQVCSPGTLSSSGGCSINTLSLPISANTYDALFGSTNATTPIAIKSSTGILSNGASFSYGGLFLGAAPNLQATYFFGPISAPYVVDVVSGNVRPFSVAFSTTGLPATPGNVSMDMDIVANVWSPIGGACSAAGFFDGIWIEEPTLGSTQINSRPTGTCLVNVWKVGK